MTRMLIRLCVWNKIVVLMQFSRNWQLDVCPQRLHRVNAAQGDVTSSKRLTVNFFSAVCTQRFSARLFALSSDRVPISPCSEKGADVWSRKSFQLQEPYYKAGPQALNTLVLKQITSLVQKENCLRTESSSPCKWLTVAHTCTYVQFLWFHMLNLTALIIHRVMLESDQHTSFKTMLLWS